MAMVNSVFITIEILSVNSAPKPQRHFPFTQTMNHTMNRTTLFLLRPMILVFVLLNAFFIVGKSWLLKKGIDQEVLIVGNLIVFAVTLITFLITNRSLKAKNPNVFIRAMYAGFIIKFFVIAIAAFVYGPFCVRLARPQDAQSPIAARVNPPRSSRGRAA